MVERAADAKKRFITYMQIYICRTGINMTKKRLDIFDIHSALE